MMTRKEVKGLIKESEDIELKSSLSLANEIVEAVNPLKFISHAQLRLVRIKGVKIYGNILDRLDCNGTLWEMVDQSEEFLRKNIRLLGFRTERSFRSNKGNF